MAYLDDDYLSARVGFSVNETDLSSIQTQLDKINNASMKLASSFSNVEKALKQLNSISSNSNDSIASNSKKTNAEIREEAKRTTLELKAQLSQQISDDKHAKAVELNELRSLANSIRAEENKEVATHKANEQIRVAQNKSALQTIQRNERNASTERKQIQKQEVKEASSQFAQMASIYKTSLNTMKNDFESFSNITQMGSVANNVGGTFTKQLSYAVMQVTGVRALINQFATVSKDIVDINKNAINVQRIMGDTTSETAEKLTESAFNIASATSTIVTDVQNIQSSWVRINEAYANNLSLLEQITDKTAKFINVGEITDAEEAVSLLNSSILQFRMYTENADGSLNINMDEVDETLNKWAYMADKTAMGTADEFGESLSKIGGQMELLGGDIDDAIVMTSILGDRLAKTGDEAGNSLKTITAYLTRDKTLNLFKDLGLETDEFNNSLMKTNTKFEEFSVIMDHLSGAYNEAVAEGNDVVAKAIQTAIGATRQGDASVALLKNWAKDSAKYYGMIKEAEEGSYLDEQNEKLMQSFEAQWNSLTTAITRFANTIATSGLLGDIQSVMGALTKAFEVLSNSDKEVVGYISKLTELGVSLVGLKKVLQMTGVWDKFKAGFEYGTVAVRQEAEALMKHKLAVLEDEQAVVNLNKASKDYFLNSEYRNKINSQQLSLTKQSLALEELNAKYKAGTITAKQYIDAVNKLVVAETRETQATEADSVANEVHIQTVRQEVNSTLAEMNGQTSKTSMFLTKLGSGFSTLGASIVASLKSPIFWLTTIGSLVVFIHSKLKDVNASANEKISDLKEKFEENKTSIDDLNSQLEDTNNKIKELYQNSNDGKLNLASQDELDKLKETRSELENTLELKEKLAKDQEKDIAKTTIKAVKKYDKNDLAKELDNYEKISKMDSDAVAKEIQDLENSSEYLTKTETKRLEELKKFQNGDRSSLLEEAQQLQEYLDTLQNLQYFDGGEDVQNTIQELQTMLDSINNSVSTDSEKFQSFINKADFAETKNEILQLASAGELTVEKLKEFDSVNDFIDKTGITAGQLVREFNELADSTNAITNSIEVTDVSEFIQGLSDSISDISSIDETIKKVVNGEFKESDIAELITKYDGFYTVANKGVEEQIQWLQKYKIQKQEAYNTSLEEQEQQLLQEQKTLLEQISSLYNSKGEVIDGEALLTAKENLDIVNTSLEKIRAFEKIKIEFDIGDVVSQLGSITSGIDDLVEAQNKLAEGTALSKAELWDLCQTYPELLYQSNLFTTTEAGNQKNMIDAIANMKEQEYDNNIDLMIANIQAKLDETNEEIDIENNKMATLARIKQMSTQTNADYSKQLAEAITDYENQTVKKHQDAEQSKVNTSSQSVQKQGSQYGWINQVMTNVFNQQKNNKIKAEDIGNTGALQSANTFLQKYSGGVAGRLSSLFGSIANKFKNAITGNKDTKIGGIGGLTTGTSVSTGSGSVVAFDGQNYTIDDQLIGDWANQQSSIVEHTIRELKTTRQGYINAINNLEQLKGMSISEVSNTYGANSPDRASNNGKEKASKDNTDSVVNELVSAIESLQSRLVKALKAQYQELYDARVKLLKAEQEQQVKFHNERIDQLQAEIDKLKGETIEDKEGDLTKLKNQYNEWLKDDSSTGKGKQKELKDKIDDLENEIAIDKLEDQIDNEQATIDSINDKFDELLDEDSPNFDSELKSLNQKMSDEQLYNEANNLIRNNQLATIVDLITRYDPDYSGIATLMGQTAGQVIGSEVANAMASWQTYKSGNYSTTSSSSSTSSASSTPANKAVVTIKKNDSLWKLAQQYYGDGSKWTKIQNANNGVNPNRLQVGQQIVIPFSTGGYTGNDEGLAYLHRKERVLTSEQTSNFDKLVNSYLPTIDEKLTKVNNSTNSIINNNVEFNKELVSVNIDRVVNNTQTDIDNANDNLDRMFRKSLQKSGINFNK